MYFFDKEYFNCNAMPSDWEDYATTIRELINAYAKGFAMWYESNNNSSLDCEDKIVSLFDTWKNTLLDNTRTTLASLIAELTATSTDTCNFDSTKHTNYLNAYNKMVNTSNEITLLITSECMLIGVENNVGVDSINILPTNGVTKNKISTCNGVYMKQMNNGSEFIGKVTVDNPFRNEWSGGVTFY